MRLAVQQLGAHPWSTNRLLQQLEHNDNKQSYWTWSKERWLQSDLDLLRTASVKPLRIAYNYCQYFFFRSGQTSPSHAALYTSTVYVKIIVLYRPHK